MPNTREKLIELLMQAKIGWTKAELADHLIANGVTLQNRDDHWATEAAYKNGYEDGKPKWISVKDRLPDLELVEAKANDFDLYACLATIKNERARNGRYVGKAWYDGELFMDSDFVDITYDVTHWMPLPEPPKGE